MLPFAVAPPSSHSERSVRISPHCSGNKPSFTGSPPHFSPLLRKYAPFSGAPSHFSPLLRKYAPFSGAPSHFSPLLRKYGKRLQVAGHKEGSKAFARYRVIDEVAEANAKEIDKDIKRGALKVFEAI